MQLKLENNKSKDQMKQVKELMHKDWYEVLEPVLNSPPIRELGKKLIGQVITPKWDNVFKAYEQPPGNLRVLILGQDPYPTPGQANGLAFSSADGRIPYSLQNIFKDLQLCDYDRRLRTNPDLSDWAAQGVMLLNTCLTTKPGEPFAHKNWGWEVLIRATLEHINSLKQRMTVMAWGKAAQELITRHITDVERKLILKAAHPANERYAKGSFISSKHFETCDEYFKSYNITPINWI